MNTRIRISKKEDIQSLLEVIRSSFKGVAERFNLTQDNAPRHPSNCTAEWVQKDMERGVTYFIIENEEYPVGCVALEQAHSHVCYLERLAVLPDQRRRGFGKALVEHVLSEAKHLAAHRVNIGIIAEHAELKNWYKAIGFSEGETVTFPHVPFRVTFMAFDLEKNRHQELPADATVHRR